MTLMTTPIIQFGTSKFLQAHADCLFHEAGLEDAVTVVASSGGAAGENRLQGFNNRRGFPIQIRGLENGKVVKSEVQVQSVAQGVSCSHDWADIQQLAVENADYIISNTTESGFDVPQGLVLDLSDISLTPPPTYPAKLLSLLHARYAAGRSGMTILPTELLSRNGDRLKAVVVRLSRNSGATENFVEWIERECLFVNSLVDRIVSEAIDPVGAIAEPYALWAIEHQPGLEMPCRHPSIQIVEDLETIERLKLHILNLGHTLLGEFHLREYRNENESVYDMLSDPAIIAALQSVYETEVLPGFAARGLGQEAVDYIGTTMERFLNPFLDHKMAFVVKNHAAKVTSRIGDFIEWAALDGSNAANGTLVKVAARYKS